MFVIHTTDFYNYIIILQHYYLPHAATSLTNITKILSLPSHYMVASD